MYIFLIFIPSITTQFPSTSLMLISSGLNCWQSNETLNSSLSSLMVDVPWYFCMSFKKFSKSLSKFVGKDLSQSRKNEFIMASGRIIVCPKFWLHKRWGRSRLFHISDINLGNKTIDLDLILKIFSHNTWNFVYCAKARRECSSLTLDSELAGHVLTRRLYSERGIPEVSRMKRTFEKILDWSEMMENLWLRENKYLLF